MGSSALYCRRATGVFVYRMAGDAETLINRGVNHRHNLLLPPLITDISLLCVDDGIGVARYLHLTSDHRSLRAACIECL